MNVDLINRLWNNSIINKDTKCWLWQGSTFKFGYGQIRYNGTNWTIHRLSLCIYLKLLYKDKWVACHICSNPNCWNPLHLYVGTQSDNIIDTIKNGTHFATNKLRCPQGHEYDKINKRGQRCCSICIRKQSLESYYRRKTHASNPRSS